MNKHTKVYMIQHGHVLEDITPFRRRPIGELIQHLDEVGGWDTEAINITREQKQLLWEAGEYSFVVSEVCATASSDATFSRIDELGVWHYHKLRELEER